MSVISCQIVIKIEFTAFRLPLFNNAGTACQNIVLPVSLFMLR